MDEQQREAAKPKYLGSDTELTTENRGACYEAWGIYRDYCETDEEYIAEGGYNADIADFRAGFANGYDAGIASMSQGWTPVSEGLPELGGEFNVSYLPEDGCEPPVLVTAADYYAKTIGKNEKGKWYYAGGGDQPEIANVLAWRPLPEPYKQSPEEGKE